jgi:hypothetical protein
MAGPWARFDDLRAGGAFLGRHVLASAAVAVRTSPGGGS